MKSKIVYAYYLFRALLVNAWIEFRLRRKENARRNWHAYKVGGGGVVPLGKCRQDAAISKASKLGSVSFVDADHAVIFYSTNL